MWGRGWGCCWVLCKNWSRPWGTWVAESVKLLTLDLGSGHDLTVHGLEPHIWPCPDSAVPDWDSLSPFLSLPLPHSCSLSLSLSPSQNKWPLKKRKEKKRPGNVSKAKRLADVSSIHSQAPTPLSHCSPLLVNGQEIHGKEREDATQLTHFFQSLCKNRLIKKYALNTSRMCEVSLLSSCIPWQHSLLSLFHHKGIWW